MPRPGSWAARSVGLVAVVGALAGTSALVWQASYSSFSATTSNSSNTWAAGTVVLNNDSSTAMFSATGLKPGSTATKCIAVTSTGSLASAVKLYGSSYTTTNGLGSALNLTITQGTGATTSSCSGFVADTSNSSVYTGTLAGFSAATSFSNGLGTWTPTGTASETKAYRFVYTVDPSAANSVQGGTAAIGFTWEAQNS
ncbi:TasA family protein [uncultured Amnibacterium sp.]|uniref:TasA family protein n=1 Tax=uncultured Amnibacterium sp. TaxID=1631851 RepID=UPI0035CC3919